MPKLLPPLLAALLLAGCTSLTVMRHVPMATLSRLASLDLVRIVPSDLRVAARLPSSLEPRPGGVTMRLELNRGRGQETYAFVLEEATEPNEAASLVGRDLPAFRIWIYRLSASDAARLDQVRSEAASAPRHVTVSIAAGVEACHRGERPAGPVRISTYLRTEGSDYFTLLDDLDLRSVVGAQALATKVPPCA